MRRTWALRPRLLAAPGCLHRLHIWELSRIRAHCGRGRLGDEVPCKEHKPKPDLYPPQINTEAHRGPCIEDGSYIVGPSPLPCLFGGVYLSIQRARVLWQQQVLQHPVATQAIDVEGSFMGLPQESRSMDPTSWWLVQGRLQGLDLLPVGSYPSLSG